MSEEPKSIELLPLVSDVVAVHLSNNTVRSSEVAPLIRTVYQALAELSINGTSTVRPEPAVPIKSCDARLHYLPRRRSAAQDAETSFADGPWHVARSVSTAFECARELSDGGAELCQEAQQACEGYRTWYRATSEARKGVARL